MLNISTSWFRREKMKHRPFSILLIVTLSAALFACGQSGDLDGYSKEKQWLAIVGDDTITVNQYRLRYETSPHTGFEKTARRDFLDALIIEHLFAQAAADTSEAFRMMFDQLIDEAAVEAWMMDNISARIQVPDSTVHQHFLRAIRELMVDAWTTLDSTAAEFIARRARGDIAFNEAAPPELTDALLLDSLRVKWNTTAPELEDSLYALDPGGTAGPIKVDDRWWIVHLVSWTQNRIPGEAAFAEFSPWVEDALRARAARAEQNELLAESMAGSRMTIDPDGWRWLVDMLSERLVNSHRSDLEIPLTVLPETRISVNESSAWADKTVVQASTPQGDIEWTGRDLLERLHTSPRPLPEFTDENTFQHRLHAHLRWLVEFETLARIAFNEGYLDSARVQRDIVLWRKHLLARETLRSLAGQAIPEEVLTLETASSSTLDKAALDWIREAASRTNIRVNKQVLQLLDLVDVPVMVRKRHFPNRPATPLPVGYAWAQNVELSENNGDTLP